MNNINGENSKLGTNRQRKGIQLKGGNVPG